MATVPATRVWTAGEVVTDAFMNNNVSAVLNFLLARPILRCRNTSAQSLTNNVFSAVLFDTEDIDSSGMHSTVTNTSRATPVYAGWYRPSGGVGFAAGATGSRAADFRQNGTAINGSQSNMNTLASGTSQVVLSAEAVFCNGSTDYIEIGAFHNQGVALNTAVSGDQQSRFNVFWESN